MTHVTCRLTAKNRDQLRNPTLGNRVWATFTFTYVRSDGERLCPGEVFRGGKCPVSLNVDAVAGVVERSGHRGAWSIHHTGACSLRMNDIFRLHAELTHADLLRNFCPPMSRNSAAGGLRPQNAFKRTGVVSEGEGLGGLIPPPLKPSIVDDILP